MTWDFPCAYLNVPGIIHRGFMSIVSLTKGHNNLVKFFYVVFLIEYCFLARLVLLGESLR